MKTFASLLTMVAGILFGGIYLFEEGSAAARINSNIKSIICKIKSIISM